MKYFFNSQIYLKKFSVEPISCLFHCYGQVSNEPCLPSVPSFRAPNPHPGLIPLIAGLTRDLLREKHG